MIVVVFLRGGCDALSLFPPLTGPDRGHYEIARPALQIPTTGPGAALDLNGQFGLHPSGALLKTLYDQGSLAIVRATGNTVQPSRSHFDAQAYLETGTPATKGTGSGWLTRYFNSIGNLPPSIIIPSVAASHYTPTSMAGDPNVLTMSNPGSFNIDTAHFGWNERQFEVLNSMYAGSAPTTLAGAQALTAVDIISAEDFTSYAPEGGAVYPDNDFGNQLKILAQIMKMNVGLRVAATDLQDWDTHNDQGVGAGGYFADTMVAALAGGLHAFATDLAATDLFERTTIIVQTEFGRRLKENADAGTDHGLGADMLLLGGNVNGGQFYGNWPGLSNAQLFDGMDIDITTDFRQVLSEVLIRRLENPYLGDIFPGYLDYSPLGVVQGVDLDPIYQSNNQIFSDGFED
jgi:uncharacterized protein (DUF1501 family)